MEIEVGPGMLSLICLVTTESDFTRDEGTHLIAYQNASLDNKGGGGGINIQEPRGSSDLPLWEFS